MAIKRQAGATAGDLSFDMTPMIDVVFQLILFFITTLTMIETQASAELILPLADRAQPPTDNTEKELFVFNVVDLNKKKVDGSLVFPEGTPPYFVSGRYVSDLVLKQELDLAAERNRTRSGGKEVDSAVIIRGDRDVAWVYVMAAMKRAQEAGFTKVYLKALTVEQNAKPTP